MCVCVNTRRENEPQIRSQMLIKENTCKLPLEVSLNTHNLHSLMLHEQFIIFPYPKTTTTNKETKLYPCCSLFFVHQNPGQGCFFSIY